MVHTPMDSDLRLLWSSSCKLFLLHIEEVVTCHRRFPKWTASKVFQKLWVKLLKVYDDLRYIPHIRHRGEERFIELRYSAKRWVVERTNSWHNRFRKLLVRYEKKSENYLTLVFLACCIIVYRRTILGYALRCFSSIGHNLRYVLLAEVTLRRYTAG